MYVITCRMSDGYYRWLEANSYKSILTLWKARCEDDERVRITDFVELEQVSTVSTKLLGKELAKQAKFYLSRSADLMSNFIDDRWDLIEHTECRYKTIDTSWRNQEHCKFYSDCRYCFGKIKIPKGGWPHFLKVAWPAYLEAPRNKRSRQRLHKMAMINPRINLSDFKLNPKAQFSLARIPIEELWTLDHGFDGEPGLFKLGPGNILSVTRAFRLIRNVPDDDLTNIREAAQGSAALRKEAQDLIDREAAKKAHESVTSQVEDFVAKIKHLL